MTAVTKLSCSFSKDQLLLLLAHGSDEASSSLEARAAPKSQEYGSFLLSRMMVHTIYNGLRVLVERDDKEALFQVRHALQSLRVPGRSITYAVEAFIELASEVAFALETHWIKAAMEGQP